MKFLDNLRCVCISFKTFSNIHLTFHNVQWISAIFTAKSSIGASLSYSDDLRWIKVKDVPLVRPGMRPMRHSGRCRKFAYVLLFGVTQKLWSWSERLRRFFRILKDNSMTVTDTVLRLIYSSSSVFDDPCDPNAVMSIFRKRFSEVMTLPVLLLATEKTIIFYRKMARQIFFGDT